MRYQPDALPLRKTEHRTLRDQVYHQLRSAVMSGSFAPGQSVTLPGLAEALGTSHMPVREAMRQLMTDGAIEMLPNRTARIPLMTRDRLRDVSTARVALEGLTTERAASMLSMAEVGRLQALDRQMKRVAKDADARTYLQLNQEFHFLIYEAAKSPVLLSLIERLWLQAGPFIAQTFTREGVNAGLEKHAIVVDALKSRDAAAARRAIESDIREAADLLLASHNFPDSVLTNAGEGH